MQAHDRDRLGVLGGVSMGGHGCWERQGVQARVGNGLEVRVAGRWGRVTRGTAPGYSPWVQPLGGVWGTGWKYGSVFGQGNGGMEAVERA